MPPFKHRYTLWVSRIRSCESLPLGSTEGRGPTLFRCPAGPASKLAPCSSGVDPRGWVMPFHKNGRQWRQSARQGEHPSQPSGVITIQYRVSVCGLPSAYNNPPPPSQRTRLLKGGGRNSMPEAMESVTGCLGCLCSTGRIVLAMLGVN